MRRGYLGLGSNVGDRRAHLRFGFDRLDACGIEVLAVSSLWETEPVDGAGPDPFLNLVARVEFPMSPPDLLARLLGIEREAGRRRRRPLAPRELDLDVLWIDGERWQTADLTVPHPRMWERAFVLAPLGELAPDLRDPRSGRTVAEALGTSRGGVRRVGAWTSVDPSGAHRIRDRGDDDRPV